MRKRYVRAPRFACLIAIVAIVSSIGSGTVAQSTDPTRLPLLTADALGYLGGFRLPSETVNGDSFSIGGGAMAFNPAADSLFVSTRAGTGRRSEHSDPVGELGCQRATIRPVPAAFRRPDGGPPFGSWRVTESPSTD